MESATLLDLYSGCGAMSTGLCLGAALSGMKLNNRWAVDMNEHACKSLQHNHPSTKVRTMKAEYFLSLLQHWDALCKKYEVHKNNSLDPDQGQTSSDDEDANNETLPTGTFEVEKLLNICYGDPRSSGKVGLRFKVRWKGYKPADDTWEPIDGLSDSPESIKEFVESGYRENILPLPVLPKFPLPIHAVVNRGVVPNAFLQCLVTHDKVENKKLKKALVLRDAISDLPKVGNHQPHDVLEHRINPKTKFQRYIRLSHKDMMDYSFGDTAHEKGKIFDHQPLILNNDDYERVQHIPVEKGANFRDLKGVMVGEDKAGMFDPDIPRVYLSSGKPLVPNYAMTYVRGRSLKPFGRLWWDEIVPTVVTRAEPHNQIILHPTQHRVLTVRENARLQGFPDYYKLFGPLKQKYMQVGNAVAVPVARALGCSLANAYRGECDDDQPVFELPENFGLQDQAKDKTSFAGTPSGEVVLGK